MIQGVVNVENKRDTRGGFGLVFAKIEFDISAHRQRHVVHGVNIPRMENGGFSYLNSTPGEPRPLQGQEGGRECEKAKAELSPRAEEVVGGLATELFKSRPDFPRPPLLDSFATVETKEISFRRPARGMFEGWRGA